MAAKVVSLRLDEELLEWATRYAESRGVSRTDLLVEGLVSFRRDCETGVPEIRERVHSSVRAAPSDGVGVCPERGDGKGHVWASAKDDPLRSCVFNCGTHGREPEVQGRDSRGHFAEATRSRAETFSSMAPPMQNGTGDPAKAWPKGMPPDMAERVTNIRADLVRQDREHPWATGPDGRRVRS